MKKNLKPMIISALTAIAMGGIGVGTTFALFTDKAETSISVKAGIVDVSATLNNVTTYSAVADSEGTILDENGAHYRQDPQASQVVSEETRYMFSNSGYATFNTTSNLLSINRMTPGDKIAFSFDLANASNVNFKYRFTYTAVDTDSDPSTSYFELIKGLTTTIKSGDSETLTYKGLTAYQSEWELYEPTDTLDSVAFTIELPMNKGNVYQNLDAKIILGFEAVQGNAYTDDAGSYSTVEEDIVSTTSSVAVVDTPTTVKASSSDDVYKFEVTVPANAEYEGGAVTADDELTIEVTDLGKTEEVYTTETSLNFDLVLKVNDEEVNNFTNPLTVKVKVGTGLIISNVNHNGTDIANYTYDAEHGYITFVTTSFSPFTLDYLSGVEVRTDEELRNALANGGTIGVKEDILDGATRYQIKKDTRIVGFGHTVKTVNDDRCFNIEEVNDITVNFENVSLVQGKLSAGYSRGVSIWGCENVTLNFLHANVSSTYYAINVAGSNDHITVNLDDSTFSAGWCAFQTWSDNTVFNANNSTLTGTNDKNYASSGDNDFGTIVVNEEVDNALINLNHCVINADYTGAAIHSETEHNNQSLFLIQENAGSALVNSVGSTYKVNGQTVDLSDEDVFDELVFMNGLVASQALEFNLNGACIYKYAA